MTATFADPTDTRPTPPHNVLRAPDNADNYRIKVGRYGDRWYTDPLPADDIADESNEAWPSVSIVKKASGNDWTMVGLRRVAHADDLAAIAATGFYERYERLKVINKLGLSSASRRGTNVHTYAECKSYGIPCWINPKDEGGSFFPTVDRIWSDFNPKLVAAEFVAVHRNLNGGIGYGGTSDGIFEIDGKWYMVDWKSRGDDSDHGCYPEEAAQLGAYAGAEYVIVADDDESNPHGAKRIAVPELAGGLIFSIKSDSYEVYPVDLEAGFEHFTALHAWWCARRNERVAIGRKWAPRRSVDTSPVPPEGVSADENAEPGGTAAAVARPIPESASAVADSGVVVALADADMNEVERAIVEAANPELLASVEDREARKAALYARYDQLTPEQQEAFGSQVVDADKDDLDAVEALLDRIENPPTTLEQAKDRMAFDAQRALSDYDRALAAAVVESVEADSRLSAEGGEANPDDVKTFEARWELGMGARARTWTGDVVKQAIDAKCDFRLSTLSSQRRADIYCALTEWCTTDDFDPRNDTGFRAALVTALDDDLPESVMSDSLGVLVGTLTTEQAARLRYVVTEIAADRMSLAIDADVAPRWVPANATSTESASA